MCVVGGQDWDSSQLRQRRIVRTTFRECPTQAWRALPRRKHTGNHLRQFQESYSRSGGSGIRSPEGPAEVPYLTTSSAAALKESSDMICVQAVSSRSLNGRTIFSGTTMVSPG